MSLLNKLAAATVSVLISGCAATTSISTSGSNLVCSGKEGFYAEWTFGTGGIETQQKCEMAAVEYCKKSGKQAKIISAKNTNTYAYTSSTAQVLFACTSPEEERLATIKQQKQDEQDERLFIAKAKSNCETLYGFKPDTTEMSNCLMEMSKRHADDVRAYATSRAFDSALDRNAEAINSEQRVRDSKAMFNQALQRSQGVTCHKYGDTTTCH
jgi:hypothetical protein